MIAQPLNTRTNAGKPRGMALQMDLVLAYDALALMMEHAEKHGLAGGPAYDNAWLLVHQHRAAQRAFYEGGER